MPFLHHCAHFSCFRKRCHISGEFLALFLVRPFLSQTALLTCIIQCLEPIELLMAFLEQLDACHEIRFFGLISGLHDSIFFTELVISTSFL